MTKETDTETPTDRPSAATCGSVTALDGYRAAGMEIKALLADATKRKPRRHLTTKQQMLAGYRAGYHAGLLMAWCMHSYGEFPQINAEAIRKVLSTDFSDSPREAVQQHEKHHASSLQGVDSCAGGWYVTNKAANKRLRGPYKYAETAAEVRAEMERNASERWNLWVECFGASNDQGQQPEAAP